MKTVKWEPAGNGRFWTVEHDGMLKTGPFATKEAAHRFFRNELDEEIVIEGDCDEHKDEEANEERETGATTEETEYLDGKGPTETFYGHCPGCAAAGTDS